MPRCTSTRLAPNPRQGVVLPAVLMVIVILSLAAYQYSDMMMAEYRASTNALKAVQARALAESGVHYVAALLSNPDTITNVLNGNLFHNPSAFQDQLVQDAT